MTVASNNNRFSAAGDDVTTSFALGATFIFFDESELEVYEIVDATGVETLQTITTDYTVTGGSGATGTVEMVTAPASGVTLLVLRKMPLTSDLDLISNTASDAETLEDAIDKLTLAGQQFDEELGRAIKYKKGETTYNVEFVGGQTTGGSSTQAGSLEFEIGGTKVYVNCYSDAPV